MYFLFVPKSSLLLNIFYFFICYNHVRMKKRRLNICEVDLLGKYTIYL